MNTAVFGRDDRPGHPWARGPHAPTSDTAQLTIRSPYAAPFEFCLSHFPMSPCPRAPSRRLRRAHLCTGAPLRFAPLHFGPAPAPVSEPEDPYPIPEQPRPETRRCIPPPANYPVPGLPVSPCHHASMPPLAFHASSPLHRSTAPICTISLCIFASLANRPTDQPVN